MKNVQRLAVLAMLLPCLNLAAQVKTNFSNDNVITGAGVFAKSYGSAPRFEIAAKNIKELLAKEAAQVKKDGDTKPFYIAEPVAVNLDIARQMQWVADDTFAYGKYTVHLNGALSASINFDRFYLPPGAVMYIYSKEGNMITGPVTAAENSSDSTWGSWVYSGPEINIEIKVPAAVKKELILHSNNVAYGYKEVYRPKVNDFGAAGSCNINVLCPLGIGWEPERNSVALVLSDNGNSWCSGAMVMNTCGNNKPFFLTANHCFTPQGLPRQDVTKWRFTFQAWSPVCPNPGVNADGVTYNGSVLRASYQPSDFCLVELNATPPANSGIRYAGWSRSTTPAQVSTGIHHPSGDLMKISRSNTPLTVASAFGSANHHWQIIWSQGVTEGGSSGSPLFDQNHRIVGQLQGGASSCSNPSLRDYYGRFDLSWTGGGTPATRLSDWLDPAGSNAPAVNTTNVSALTDVNPASYVITGPAQFCTAASYTIPNLPAGAVLQWYVNQPTGMLSYTVTNNILNITRNYDGDAVIDARITLCGATISKQKNVRVGGIPLVINTAQTGCAELRLTAVGAPPGALYNWSSAGNTILFNGVSNTLTTTAAQVTATGSNDFILLSAVNTCQQPVQTSVTYAPFERTIEGLYPEYVSCGDHLSLSVNTTPYDTYYRWYVNDVLVSEGTWVSSYCTCYYLGKDARQFGRNTVRVEVETSCGVNVFGTGDFYSHCGTFYKSAVSAYIFPNPASGSVRVHLNQNKYRKATGSITQISVIRILDKTGNIKLAQRFSGNTQSVTLNISNLSADIHYVYISDGKHSIKLPLSVKK